VRVSQLVDPLTCFTSCAEEVRIHPRAIKSTSPRRAAVGHAYRQDSSKDLPKSSRGQDSDNGVSEPCHAGQRSDARVSELSRTSIASNGILNIRHGHSPGPPQRVDTEGRTTPSRIRATTAVKN
jgi:hypothetical protein